MAVTYFTMSEAAAALRISPRQLRTLAVQHGIGNRVSKRIRLFTTTDLRAIQRLRRPRGNPNFVRKP